MNSRLCKEPVRFSSKCGHARNGNWYCVLEDFVHGHKCMLLLDKPNQNETLCLAKDFIMISSWRQGITLLSKLLSMHKLLLDIFFPKKKLSGATATVMLLIWVCNLFLLSDSILFSTSFRVHRLYEIWPVSSLGVSMVSHKCINNKPVEIWA